MILQELLVMIQDRIVNLSFQVSRYYGLLILNLVEYKIYIELLSGKLLDDGN